MSAPEGLFHRLAVLRACRSTLLRGRSLETFDWEHYLQVARGLTDASFALCLDLSEAPVRIRGAHGLSEGDLANLASWLSAPDARAFFARVRQRGVGVRAASPGAPFSSAFAALVMPNTEQPLVLMLDRAVIPEADLKSWMVRAGLVADLFPEPVNTNLTQVIGRKLPDDHLVRVLGVLSDTLQARLFPVASYTLVNGLAAALPSVDQVILGWRHGAYVRVRAISHYEQFERNTETVRLMEAALEEAADQDLCIQLASDRETGEPGVVDVAHRQLCRHLGASALITLPLSGADGQSAGALSLVSLGGVISEHTLSSAYFVGQTACGHLANLDAQGAGLWARFGRGLSRGLAGWFGGENLWLKVAMVLISALLVAAALTPIPHAVKGSARFVTDQTRLISAPWAGTVESVLVTSGDAVDAEQVLAVLDTDERLLQLAELQAELQRNLAEQDRARAEFNTVDSAVAEARVAQTRARISQVQRQIDQATLRAPMAGIVVEGDRRDLISRPVNPGDPLMRIAQIAQIYLAIEVPEDDVGFVGVGSTGEFSLVARPSEPIAFTVSQVIPMAQYREGQGAIFAVHGALDASEAPWWRPGMTGVARIDVGERSALWVLGHKAWNRFRLWLWW